MYAVTKIQSWLVVSQKCRTNAAMVKGQRELVIMLMHEDEFQQMTRKVQGWKPRLPLSSWAEKFVMSSWLSIDRRLSREVLGP
jgi:hypothetical protein